MTKKIPVKNLYLIAVISVGLIGLAIGSTYAMFTATAEIGDPISLSSNLSYTSDIVETVDVTVEPGVTEYVTLDITNNSSGILNYVAWYIDDSGNCNFGSDLEAGSSTSGSINSGSYFPLGVFIKNNGTNTTTVTLGVSSSVGNVVLANDMKILPNDPIIEYSVTIQRKFDSESATTISTLKVGPGGSISSVSVVGTSAYPAYDSISCTNGQRGDVTKSVTNNIDTANVKVRNVTNNTVCTVVFMPSYTVEIRKSIDNGASTYVDTVKVIKGHDYSVTVNGGSYYSMDSVSCTNGQTASVSEIFNTNYQVDANFSIKNVTNNTVCTIKMIS